MCLAVPGKVIEVIEGESPTERTGLVDFQGSQVQASLAMVPDAGVGSYVLVHAGFAITELDEQEARETWASIAEAMGDVDLPGKPNIPEV